MSAVEPRPPVSWAERLRTRRDALLASPRFQAWAARFPLTRAQARRDGERLFDLVAGFTYSQVLHAVVSLRLPDHLAGGPKSVGSLAMATGLPPERMDRLCRAAVALDLLVRQRDGRFRLARLGAAMRGVPGLQDMILHHNILYRDLSAPEAFLRGETEPELAAFWPYVFGEGARDDPEQATKYSRLMSDTQALVAEETLKAVDLTGIRRMMDIGGGSGAFLKAVLEVAPQIEGVVADLPGVPPTDDPRITQRACNFRTDPLPRGMDAVSLIRVLYDHEDATVTALLSKVHAALPSGGRLIISEPMSGGDRPTRSGDVYFALYCMAMGTGTVRAPGQVAQMLRDAGFVDIKVPRIRRDFVTQVVTAQKV